MKRFTHTGIISLLLFAGTTFNSCWSQVEAIVKGKVVNEAGLPVQNAVVKLGIRDTRTNSSGFFIVKNIELPAQLTVKHSLYKEYQEMIVHPDKWKDTVRIFIEMTGKEKELEEVTVSADKIFWVYTRKQANILDFILQPDNEIMLCCRDEDNYFLRSLDPKGEKINETRIRKNPQQLYRDCMESIHLVYSDSIYETALINNSIGFFQARATLELFKLLKSCVYKDDNNLIKYTYSNIDQRIEYTSINIQTKSSQTIYVGENRVHNRGLRDFIADNNVSDEQLFHTLDPELIRITRSKWAKRKLYEQVLTLPVYIPLFELNDSLIIFDHLNDSAIVFTKEGTLVRSFPIFYQYFPGWENELITNLEKTKVYARYESEGIATLREINPATGKTERILKLEKHVFPEHLQIHGDFIYYLYKDYLDQSMHYLFKQRLE